MDKSNGAVIYSGPSMLDGAPIVAIVTGLQSASANDKTGGMLQTWILRADVAPTTAVRSGQDASVCGDCKHRPANGGACYVTVFQAPLSVFKAYGRGVYPTVADADALSALGADRKVRIGSYGDPAAVPAHVWHALISRAEMHTGYTHQWATGAHDDLRAIVMASADTAYERDMARAAGWRTFRVRSADEPLGEREAVCPASSEAGYKTNCATCGACNGAGTGRRGSIAIVVHGAKSKVNAYAAQRAA